MFKIDQVVSTRDNLSFKYLNRYNRGDVSAAAQNNNIEGFGQHQANQQMLTGITYTRSISPVLVNEARFSVSRSVQQNFGIKQGVDYNEKFGLPGPKDPDLIGFPLFNITNYSSLGDATQMPVQFWVTSYNINDVVTWVKGSHMIKMGGEFLHDQFYRVYVQNSRGTFTFTGNRTGNPYADFLLGLPNSGSILYGTVKSYLYSTNNSLFVQDAWNISSRLTLDLGLRWELPIPLYDKFGRLASFIPELGKLAVSSLDPLAGTGVGFTDPTRVGTAKDLGIPFSLQDMSHRKFAPRFGFAWRPFGGTRTALRGGYGIFYGTWEFNNVLNNFAGVFPWVINIANNGANMVLSNPFPVAPSLTQNVVAVNGFQLKPATPYTQSWNLTLESELGRGSAVEVGYIGAKGTNLSHDTNINQPFRSAATAPNFPVPYPGWSTINYFGFHDNSIYNARSVTFRRRFTGGFFYRGNYTYSKSIDQGSNFVGQTVAGSAQHAIGAGPFGFRHRPQVHHGLLVGSTRTVQRPAARLATGGHGHCPHRSSLHPDGQ